MKIGFDMGHTLSGIGTGAQKIVKETDINRAVGNLVIKYLKQMGETVINCTVDLSSKDLADRVAIANKNNVDLFVSLHLNAGGGTGTETYTYLNASASTKAKAKKVNDAIVALGFKNRGIKEANFYVLRETKAPAYLIELYFVDSQTDVNLYNKLGADKVARAIAEAICGKKIPTSTTPSGTYYRAIAGSYTDKANANAQVEKLKKDGFSAFLDATTKDGKTYYRVVAGSYSVRANADKTVAQLKAKGYSAFVAVYEKEGTTSTPAPTPKPPVTPAYDENKEISRYKENGTCTVVTGALNFRSAPSTKASVQGQYLRNEKVRYDLVVITERYVWISWIGASSGKRRYMAVKDKKTNERFGNCV